MTEKQIRAQFEEKVASALRSGDSELVHEVLDPDTAKSLSEVASVLNPFLDLLEKKEYSFSYKEPDHVVSELPSKCLYVLVIQPVRGRFSDSFSVGEIDGMRRIMFVP